MGGGGADRRGSRARPSVILRQASKRSDDPGVLAVRIAKENRDRGGKEGSDKQNSLLYPRTAASGGELGGAWP